MTSGISDTYNGARRTRAMQSRKGWGAYPKGITYEPEKGLFRVRIMKFGDRVSLGRFKSLEDAVAAYNKAAVEFYGADAQLAVMPEATNGDA